MLHDGSHPSLFILPALNKKKRFEDLVRYGLDGRGPIGCMGGSNIPMVGC
jgi:hypothetical protein